MVMRLVVLVVLLVSAGTVQAQSLAELSRRIRADRAQRDAAGQTQPDKPPDLTKNVLTNADLYVYTIPPRPVHYERTVVYVLLYPPLDANRFSAVPAPFRSGTISSMRGGVSVRTGHTGAFSPAIAYSATPSVASPAGRFT